MSEQTETKERPDYEIAREELGAWYAESGLECEISAPRAGVDPAKGEDGKPWPHVAYTLIFKRGAVSFSQDWRQGIGIGIEWRKIAGWRKSIFSGWSDEDEKFANAIAKGKTPLDRDQTAKTAANAARILKLAPSPAEVLASMAQDGAALFHTFEDWARELGYDTDSREAERTYTACCECGRNLRKILSAADVDKLQEWAARL